MDFRDRAKGLVTPRFWFVAIVIGLVIGLSAPMLDMLFWATSLEPGYESLATLLQALALLLGRYFAWYVVFLLAVVAPAALITTLPPLALASVAAIFSAVLAYQTYGGIAPRI